MKPEPDRADDFDARFAEIVAHWDAEADVDPSAPSRPPATAPSDPAAAVPPRADPLPAPRQPAPPAPRPDPIESGWRAYEPPADEEVFTPPARPPLPQPSRDPWFWVSLVGLVGGGLVLLGIAIFAPSSNGRLATGALVAFVVGFGVLVWRHSSRRAEDKEGWEDDSGTAL